MTLYDRRTGAMVGWSCYEDRACLYELGRPLHALLSIWHCDAGLQVMHGGLIARDGAGVLFPGVGGSGKSTCALACLEAGLQYLGDDYIGLSIDGDDRFTGHSVYTSCHLEPDHLERFPRLKPHAIEGRHEQEDKRLVLLTDVYSGPFLTSARIAAIAIPRVVDAEESRIVPATKGQALLALAPSSIVMVPGFGAREMDRLSRLVESVPCCRLELGRDLPSIPQRVEELIREAAP